MKQVSLQILDKLRQKCIFLAKVNIYTKYYTNSLQAAHKTGIPKSFVSGTGHFQRDVTYSTQTFQVLIKCLSKTLDFIQQPFFTTGESFFFLQFFFLTTFDRGKLTLTSTCICLVWLKIFRLTRSVTTV